MNRMASDSCEITPANETCQLREFSHRRYRVMKHWQSLSILTSCDNTPVREIIQALEEAERDSANHVDLGDMASQVA